MTTKNLLYYTQISNSFDTYGRILSHEDKKGTELELKEKIEVLILSVLYKRFFFKRGIFIIFIL